jgi:hypothetical protein
MIFDGSVMVCPSGTPGGTPLILDLEPILVSERRQDEVATATKFRAPELVAEFNRTWRRLNDILGQLAVERLKALKALRARRDVLLLEVVPKKLASLGLPSNKENREAVIGQDAECGPRQDTVDQIEAVIAYLKGKMKSFENAYTAAKKIMGDDQYGLGASKNPALSGDAGPSRPGFGKPRYGT